MKKLILGTFVMSMMVACEQQDFSSNESDDSLRVEAEIFSDKDSHTRTSTEGQTVSFKAGDKIGFYMPDSETSGVWTYSGEKWESTTEYVWPDKLQTHNFCAYYPFSKAEARNLITMPDLSQQTGTAADLEKYDFLVARCSSNYAKANGIVSFKGQEAFTHVLSLLSITLKTGEETKGAILTDVSLKATGLITTSTYHFGESSEADGVTFSESPVNELAFSSLTTPIPTEGLNYLLIVNPIASQDKLEISVSYTRDEEQFTASAQVPAATISQGSLSKLSVSIRKSGLVIEGNTVEDWTENNMDDVVLEETPVQ